MENVNNKRLQALKNSGAMRIFEAYQWVQDHRAEFKREVYGPVLLEVRNLKFKGEYVICMSYPQHQFLFEICIQVNVTNRLHADYLEGHVANYIWKVMHTSLLYLFFKNSIFCV